MSRLETVVTMLGGDDDDTPGLLGTEFNRSMVTDNGNYMTFQGALLMSYSSYVLKLVADATFVQQYLLMQGVPQAILTSSNDYDAVVKQCERLLKTMGLEPALSERQLKAIKKYLKSKKGK